ncbi:hypothetical protein R3P38DRAFT_3593727 [Favolaschia claudopus]|uniref:C2H2-type domain-containing protein n=1 Tax=Favolaschia claudopus TaxID=2862362 RepID=A0AAW0DI83_9AGAR
MTLPAQRRPVQPPLALTLLSPLKTLTWSNVPSPSASTSTKSPISPPLHTRGLCNWNGCNETIGLSRKEVSTHMEDAHGIPNCGKALPPTKDKGGDTDGSTTTPANPVCLWPLCSGKLTNKYQTHKRETSLLFHLRTEHFATQHVACPYCERVFAGRKELKKHFDDARQRVWSKLARRAKSEGLSGVV